MATDIAKLRKKRTTKRNTINRKTLVEVEQLLGDDGEVELEEREANLGARLEFLEESLSVIKELDAQIADLIDDVVEAEGDEDEAVAFKLKVSTVTKKIRTFFDTQRIKEESRSGVLADYGGSRMLSGASRKMGVRLPKFEIKMFDGDVSKWKSFADTFDAAIDSKDFLSDVEKFTYLRGYLEGDALQCIEGFPVTEENYGEAMNLLKERYGNTQVIISSHMNRLINLDKVMSCNVTELRRLYDKVESNVRALSTVGINKEHFGPLLIPIVLEKLPNAIRLQISRKLVGGKTVVVGQSRENVFSTVRYIIVINVIL